MKKLLPLAFLLSFIFLSKVVISQTVSENATWNNWSFFDTGGAGDNQYVFFSTRYINETKYFLLKSNPSMPLLVEIYRFNNLGVLEESRITSYYATLGNSLLIVTPDDILIPIVEYRLNKLHILRFNTTSYAGGGTGIEIFNLGIGIPYGGWGMGNANWYQDMYSISTLMSKGAYPSGIVEVGALTFAVAYAQGDTVKISWDFYDVTTHTFNLSSMKTADFTTGISGLNKFYLFSTEGNCFYYPDCVFHLLFEGRSSQNENRYGIYVREGRKGTFGWEFKDKGLIGFETPSGFIWQIGGIDYWYTTHHYPFLVHKIYFRAKQNDNRGIFYYLFDTKWIPVYHGLVNRANSNAFMPNAKRFENISTNYFTLNMVDLPNQTYAYFLTFADCGAPGGTIDFIATDSYNASNYNVLRDNLGGYSCTYHPDAPQNYGQYFVRLLLPSNTNKFNFTVNATVTQGTFNLRTVYLDVLDDGISAKPYRSSSNFFLVTEDVQGEIEAFFLYTGRETYRGLGYRYLGGTNSNGIQTVKEACRCTLWTSTGCYNSTHERFTRLCSPPACADEVKYVYNATCTGVIPTTTTIPPPPPVPPEYEPIAEYLRNYTDLAIGITASGLRTTVEGAKLLIWGALTIATSFFVSKKVGEHGNPGWQLGVIVAFIMMLIGGIVGFVPAWILILFIIIAGFIVAYWLRGYVGG